MTARITALVLQSRSVTLADVFEARVLIEPLAAKRIAGLPARDRKAITAELAELVAAEEEAVDDAAAFALLAAEFHERLVELAGNQTLSILIETINEIITRGMRGKSHDERKKAIGAVTPVPTRQRSIRSQLRLLRLIGAGVPDAAEEHWRTHMAIVAKLELGEVAASLVDLNHHYD
jgi:DNA-binding GntR family transcriptional regulator